MFLLLVVCGCNKNLDETEKNDTRTLVKFVTEDIPALNELVQVKFGVTPWDVILFKDKYIAVYEYRWEKSDGYIYIDEYIAEDKESALNYLLEMHQSYTNTFIEEQKDQPAVVGNISYLKGKEFIRDNIIIKIFTNGEFDSMFTEIARQIDRKIIKSMAFLSPDSVKPLIEKFEIAQNPVSEKSETQLLIDIISPDNKDLVFNWRFSPDYGYGEIRNDDLGNYYFIAGSPSTQEVGLSLIITNEYGFCADSTIYIQIE